MFYRNFKTVICACFILIFAIKMTSSTTAVFIGKYFKQVKSVAFISNEENDEKSTDADSKDFSVKDKKGMDESFVHLYEFIPVVTHINLLYKQQNALFKQTHFPSVATPPPDVA